MSSTVVAGGTVVDETGSREADVRIDGDLIVEVGPGLDRAGADRIIDAGGCVVAPGLVDLHTHLREPGREEAETVLTGSRAAALGGFTAVVAMPNTQPVIDSASVVRHVQRAGADALCHVAVAGSITVGRAGKQLSPMAELVTEGVRLFTDDGGGVQNPRLMLRALEYSSTLGVVLAQHCEDEALSSGGHIHEGAVSSRLGIAGIPPEAEEVMLMRDLALLRRTRARLHFMHLSTAGSVAMVAAARSQGLAVTSEVAPHHFTLTDEAVAGITPGQPPAPFDPVFRVNPPLRSAGHRDAVKAALVDGTVDAIATDHAPHDASLKEKPFDEAPCGMVGLETALALALTELDLPIERVLALLSWQPARIAQLDRLGHGLPVAPGNAANLVVIDPHQQWTVDPAALASRSHNTPFAGRTLRGKVRHTLHNGECVVIDGTAQR